MNEYFFGNTGGNTPTPPEPPGNGYPGYPLSEGSTGNAVSTIQRALNTLSVRYPSVPKVTVDGVFGARTKAAVIAAQRVLNLTPDGIVGQRTWKALVG
jgi:peptidoglycan hydrolase-like protein with peptidoglycan-binding domain